MIGFKPNNQVFDAEMGRIFVYIARQIYPLEY